MAIVQPTTPVQLVMQPVSEPTNREGRNQDLRVDQVIRATVVEDSDGQVSLQLAHRKFMTKTDLPLRAGQQLDVRILQTQPQLQLQILPFLRSDRIDHLLSALGYRINWAGQAQQVASMRGQLPSDMFEKLAAAMGQLRQLLGKTESLSGKDLAGLSRFLGLSSEAQAAQEGQLPGSLKVGLSALLASRNTDHFATRAEPIRQLLGQFGRIVTGPPTSVHPSLATLIPQLQAVEVGLGAAEQARFDALVQSLVDAWQSHRMLPTGSSLRSVSQALGAPLSTEQPDVVFVAENLKTGLLTLLGRVEAGQVPLDRSAALVADDIRQAVQTLQQLPTEKPALAQSAGQIRTLLERVNALQAELPAKDALVLESVLGRLRQAMPPVAAPGAFAEHLPLSEMGAIVQALGLVPANMSVVDAGGNLSVKTALEILLGLHSLARDVRPAPEVEAALQQLEVLQLARGKLQHEGQQLIPLPFPFLEEGYLLADAGEGEADSTDPETCRCSLFLRLQQLGNLRVDLLQESSGIYIKIGCESTPVRLFLEQQHALLAEALQALPLKGVSFDTEAMDPGAELIQRLRPAGRGVVDARI